MDMSWGHLWREMGFVGKSVVIVMLLMSVYSLWVMVERFITYQKAKNQSLKLLGAQPDPVEHRGDGRGGVDADATLIKR